MRRRFMMAVDMSPSRTDGIINSQALTHTFNVQRVQIPRRQKFPLRVFPFLPVFRTNHVMMKAREVHKRQGRYSQVVTATD